jgi:hypothetical protein
MTWPTYLEQARQLAEQVVAAADPYWLGIQFMGITSNVLTTGPYAGSMYVLWGALTDAIELGKVDKSLTMERMRTAARDWLALDPYDDEAVGGYFHHWLDEIVRYGR